MFATGAVTIIFVGNIVMFLEMIEYLILPSKINIYGEFHGYFSLGVLIVTAIFIKRKNFYQKLLKDVERLSADKKKRMKYLGLAYIISVFSSLFYLAHLIRVYNY
jgi:hypothetical protein